MIVAVVLNVNDPDKIELTCGKKKRDEPRGE